MGNLCSKSANKDDSFATPGRVLGSSIQTGTTSTAVHKQSTTSSPGRILGGPDLSTSPSNARSAAAQAAEERAAKVNKPGGKLATQLNAQKKQTQNQVLNAGSEQERRVRDVDTAAEARNWS